MENPQNVGVVCSECMNDKKEKTQKNIDEKIQNGTSKCRWFKICITGKDGTEHVWIRVKSINLRKRMFTGVIDNDVIIVTEYCYGQELLRSFDDIEEIIEEK